MCQNQSIAESNAELAVDLRNQINEQIKAGRSDKEIVDFMVTRYGDFVLYRPPFKATTALLWIGPIALLLLAVFVFYRTLVSRRARVEEQSAHRCRARRGATPACFHRHQQQEPIVTAFIAIATVMVVIALAWLLWPLLRAGRRATVERHVANATIYRDQFADLDADLRAARSPRRSTPRRKAELERRLLDEGARRGGRRAPVRQ